MQTKHAPDTKPAANAETSSPASPTQQPSIPTAAAAPPAASTPPALRPDLLAVADTLATRIRDCRVNALDWFISEGAALQECRDLLTVQDFYHVLRSGRVPIGVRSAQTMLRIARNKTIRDPERTHQLPGSTTVLNTLAGLPASVLAEALDAGTINPKTTLKEAQQFVAECSGSYSQATSTQPEPNLL